MTSERLFDAGKFRDTPPALRRLTDIAFSGDGEPTTHRNFDEVVAACADLKRQHQLDTLPLVLITNASMFHRDHIQRALLILDANSGEIWAKLDAGTAAYYDRINRAPFGFSAHPAEHHPGRHRASPGDPVVVHAYRRAGAAPGRVERLSVTGCRKSPRPAVN